MPGQLATSRWKSRCAGGGDAALVGTPSPRPRAHLSRAGAAPRAHPTRRSSDRTRSPGGPGRARRADVQRIPLRLPYVRRMCALLLRMACPENCKKGLRNGPCGGVRPDGSCELDVTMRCVWLEAWEGAARMAGGCAIAQHTLPSTTATREDQPGSKLRRAVTPRPPNRLRQARPRRRCLERLAIRSRTFLLQGSSRSPPSSRRRTLRIPQRCSLVPSRSSDSSTRSTSPTPRGQTAIFPGRL